MLGDANPPQLFGAPVFWADDAGGRHLYVWGEHSTLTSFALGAAGFDPTPEGKSDAVSAGQPGGILAISANGAAKGSGIVWALTPSQDNEDGALLVKGTLHAFDANDVSKELWSSDLDGSQAMGTLVKFCPPMIAGGRVFVATGDGRLQIYGLAR